MMSVDINKILSKEDIDMKKSTIVRFRKNAIRLGEDREITRAKIKAIREHDLTKGRIVRCEIGEATYIILIGK